jgi:Bacterial Ig domain/RTX calcium-binding nonapeptide repeat (4 copies)/PA domain/LVIVD repeat
VPASRLLRATPAALAASLLLASASSAFAADERRSSRTLTPDRAAYPFAPDRPGLELRYGSPAERTLLGRSAFSITGNIVSAAQHDGTDAHLPQVQENIDLVGELEMDTPAGVRSPETADVRVLPGQIADVAVHKNFAYLNSWDEPTCRRGGTFIVDISNPAAPQQTGFLPALEGRYHGEGAHAVTLNTPAFQGDLLAVNNEPYTLQDPTTGDFLCTDDILGNGGFDLYDVTNPREPKTFVQGFGDREDGGVEFPTPNSSHSIFVWQGNDRRAFAVAVDNVELTDVDIFEITDPANPRMIAEYHLTDYFGQAGIDIVDEGGLGGAGDIFLHDMVVKKIGDRFVMLADYWDAGYVTLDVTDPTDATYIGDTTFDGPDPLTGMSRQEGNGHQGEFSHDNRYILAADEDFTTFPFRAEIDGEPAEFDVGIPVDGGGFAREELLPSPGDPLEGDSRFIGDGCVLGSVPAPQAGETVALIERGTCDFDVKAGNAEAAGYDNALIFNNVIGAAPRCDAVNLNMTFDGTPAVTIKSLFIPRSVAFQMMDAFDPDTYECTPNDPASTPTPAPDRAGVPVSLFVEFDGWGYMHLYENEAGKMTAVDHFAVQEALDERYAFGFGDLSVHEFAADATENVAYSSYYAAGMRVFTFGPGGLNQTGKFIDEDGSNFWGVEQFTSGGERYFAGSDRDFGLQIFRYTGPGAAQRPVCADQNAAVPHQTAVTLSLRCTDGNGNPLTLAIASNPASGSLGALDQGADTVTYTPNAGFSGADSFTFTASDGAATSAPATVRITVGPSPRGCNNLIEGTPERDLIDGTPISDRVRAGAGRDVVDARSGSDCVFGQDDRDTLDGESGHDQLSGGDGNDNMSGSSGADRLAGGRGMDRLFGNRGNDRLSGGAKRDYLAGGHRNDRLIGGGGRDTLVGDKGNDRLSAGAGHDILRGNQGSDRIDAGGGRDTVVAGQGRDRVNVADGNVDRVSCGSGRDRAIADENDRLTNCERVTRR